MRALVARWGKLGASLACLAAVQLAASVAAAEPPPPASTSAAADLEREARQAYERREYAVAARGFEAANRAAPHASLRFNAALAWEQAGDPAKAADAYAAALASGKLEGEQEKQARARLAKLERTLATIAVEGEAASVRVDGEASGAPPITVHVTAGEHAVEMTRADGSIEEERVVLRAGEARVVKLVGTTRASPPPVPVPAPLPPPTAPPPEAPSSMPPMRVGGLVLIGLGVASAGAAIGLGVATIHARDDYVTDHPSDAAYRDRAVTLRTATDVTWAVAGALGLTGVVLAAAAPRAKPAEGATGVREVRSRAELRVGPASAAVKLAF